MTLCINFWTLNEQIDREMTMVNWTPDGDTCTAVTIIESSCLYLQFTAVIS